VFISASYQTAGDKIPRAGQILFGFEFVPPDHPPACASRRKSGADKKEKQRGEQQHRSRKRQPDPQVLLLCRGDGNGAMALHESDPCERAQWIEDARKSGFPQPSA
jgi:hypothetical protein